MKKQDIEQVQRNLKGSHKAARGIARTSGRLRGESHQTITQPCCGDTRLSAFTTWGGHRDGVPTSGGGGLDIDCASARVRRRVSNVMEGSRSG